MTPRPYESIAFSIVGQRLLYGIARHAIERLLGPSWLAVEART